MIDLPALVLRRADEQVRALRVDRRHERDSWDVKPKPRRCRCGAELDETNPNDACRTCRNAAIGPCRFDGCDRRGNSRGYCHKHYMRVFKAQAGR